MYIFIVVGQSNFFLLRNIYFLTFQLMDSTIERWFPIDLDTLFLATF